MKSALLGPAYSHPDIVQRLRAEGAIFKTLSEKDLIRTAAESLAQGKVVGWFQGRMEFGPRALGARSILGDPRNPEMQRMMNLKIKYRESFRPFAPSVLREDLGKYFELECDSPYMLLVANVREECRTPMSEADSRLFGIEKLNVPRSVIPAVTHVDYSARIQTVSRDTNPLYYALIKEFKRITGCSVLVNTSFNVRGEPIVNTPEDAFRCFMGSEMDALFVGRCWLEKEKQNVSLATDYAKTLAPD